MIAYLSGVYDILREKDLKKLDREIQMSKKNGAKFFALGIYDGSLCDKLGISEPLKSTDDRMKIMEQIIGVDFTFPVSSLDQKMLEKNIKEAYKEYQQKLKEQEENKNKPKEYNIGYTPGTYDLFHAGHLENLMLASEQCEKIIVGVKSDELVQEHKNRKPTISANERMNILRHFKFVQDVYEYYTRDPHVANDWIKSKYGKSADAIFYGSDLKKDFSKKDSADLNIVFTERDEKLMSKRSTTAYRKLMLGQQKEKHTYKGKIKRDIGKGNIKIKDDKEEDLER